MFDKNLISHLKIYSESHKKWKEVSLTVLSRVRMYYWLLIAAPITITENCWPQKLPYDKYVQLSFSLSLPTERSWIMCQGAQNAEAETTNNSLQVCSLENWVADNGKETGK